MPAVFILVDTHPDFHFGFTSLPSFGPRRLRRMSEIVKDWHVLWRAPLPELEEYGLPRPILERYVDERAKVDIRRIVDDCTRNAIRFIWHEDADYPELLRQTPDAPLGLYARGKLQTAPLSIAIVGTRKPSSYGIQVTRMLASELAAAGVEIVSGMALGIDGIAHAATLQANGRTIAVLGCGLDTPYPSSHRRLSEDITSKGGAIISEFPPRTPALRHHFPIRNRIIAGITSGVLVTEAPRESGALLTAKLALDYNRDIFAVPAPITSVTGAGTNGLLRDGATLVTRSDDVLSSYNIKHASRALEAQLDPLSDDERCVLHAFGAEQRSIDQLVQMSTLSTSAVSAALTLLELKGWVEPVDPFHYLRKR